MIARVRVQTAPGFFAHADRARARFEQCVGPSRDSTDGRFVWDYWHIPGQYTYLRTLALNVLTPTLLGQFMTALREWGTAHLGTDRATLPWLSYYVEGCRQELHSDVVQGMWSYVYSLTPWEGRHFTGGETLVGSRLLLDYWSSFDPGRSTESRHLVEAVPADYNQLCVFDARLPHGVATVEGTRDPLCGRVALHGWFLDPEPALEGALDQAAAAPALAEVARRCRDEQAQRGPILGRSVWRVAIGADGAAGPVELVVHNLVRAGSGAGDPDDVLAAERRILAGTRFPPAAGPSTLQLPVGE